MPAFNKRHYEFVAQVLRSTRPATPYAKQDDPDPEAYRIECGQVAQWEQTCLAFLNQFKSDNPQFDRERFLKACKGD